MTGFRAYASPERRAKSRAIIISPTWIGDVLLAFPAVQRLRQIRPELDLTILAKPQVAPLWALNRSVSQVLLLTAGISGSLAAGRLVRAGAFEQAWILPNSWRSAWIPWLGGVPVRTGSAGQARSFLLTEIVPRPVGSEALHQTRETARILGVDGGEPLPPAKVELPGDISERMVKELAGFSTPRIVLIPGAARGPSKRWPVERFEEVGRLLTGEFGGSVLVCGAPGERVLCEAVAHRAGGHSWAGRTTIPEWAALLSLSQMVLCNDSGGMHLAAAAGATGIALFGVTDPAITGPWGGRIRILRPEGDVSVSRTVGREETRAQCALKSISVARVMVEARRLLTVCSPEPERPARSYD